MKGTATLVLDETYNDRKAFILSCIVTSRHLIKAIQSASNRFDSLRDIAPLAIKAEQQYIMDLLAELTELKRWQLREGIGEDEPYRYGRK